MPFLEIRQVFHIFFVMRSDVIDVLLLVAVIKNSLQQLCQFCSANLSISKSIVKHRSKSQHTKFLTASLINWLKVS